MRPRPFARLAGLTVLAALGLVCAQTLAQSGRATMHGYVGFEGVAWSDLASTHTKAHIELRASAPGSHGVYKAETDEHGIYDIAPVSMGEYTLRIAAPGYRTYNIDLYLPSDFQCSLAVMLKKSGGSRKAAP